MSVSGLSPLARGTRNVPYRPAFRRRFIPAGAGNTKDVLFVVVKRTVYPRWRGEHCRSARPAHSARGLSPLARGTQQSGEFRFRNIRFIPAGAGNTTRKLAGLPATSVYPRWRGEHVSSAAVSNIFSGLSPLARGTRFRPGDNTKITRFIPAGAGNTCDRLVLYR